MKYEKLIKKNTYQVMIMKSKNKAMTFKDKNGDFANLVKEVDKKSLIWVLVSIVCVICLSVAYNLITDVLERNILINNNLTQNTSNSSCNSAWSCSVWRDEYVFNNTIKQNRSCLDLNNCSIPNNLTQTERIIGYDFSNENNSKNEYYNYLNLILDFENCSYCFPSIKDNALYLTKDASYLGYRVSSNDSSNLISNLTISAWIKPFRINTNSDQVIVSKHENFAFGINNNTLYLTVKKTDGTVETFKGMSQINPNTWYKVSVTYNGEKLRFFINENLDTEYKTNFTLYNKSYYNILVGYYEDNKQFFRGVIDDVKIFRTALNYFELNKELIAFNQIRYKQYVEEFSSGLVSDFKNFKVYNDLNQSSIINNTLLINQSIPDYMRADYLIGEMKPNEFVEISINYDYGINDNFISLLVNSDENACGIGTVNNNYYYAGKYGTYYFIIKFNQGAVESYIIPPTLPYRASGSNTFFNSNINYKNELGRCTYLTNTTYNELSIIFKTFNAGLITGSINSVVKNLII